MQEITELRTENRELQTENNTLRREAKALRQENDRLRKELDMVNKMYRQKVPKVGFDAKRMHDILLPIVLDVYGYDAKKYAEAWEHKRRWKEAVQCRQVMGWLLKNRFHFGLKKVATALNFKDHSTAVNCLQGYEDMYATNQETRIKHAEINFQVDQWDSKRRPEVKAG